MVLQRSTNLAEYAEDLASTGRIGFSREEAMEALGVSHGAFLDAAARLAKRGHIFVPRRGYYVITPTRFVKWKAPPSGWYIDAMMKHADRPYYVGMLKAAELHGAADTNTSSGRHAPLNVRAMVSRDGKRQCRSFRPGTGGMTHPHSLMVPFMRNALAHAGKSGRRVVSAFIATAFAQETTEAASQQWRAVADQIRPKLPKLATLMDDAEPDVLAYTTFPREHRTKLHSTNPIERLNGEIKRRTDVVGIFPNEAAITRLVGAILMEQSDEWAVQRARYMTLETMVPVSDNPIIMLSAVPGT